MKKDNFEIVFRFDSKPKLLILLAWRESERKIEKPDNSARRRRRRRKENENKLDLFVPASYNNNNGDDDNNFSSRLMEEDIPEEMGRCTLMGLTTRM